MNSLVNDFILNYLRFENHKHTYTVDLDKFPLHGYDARSRFHEIIFNVGLNSDVNKY